MLKTFYLLTKSGMPLGYEAKSLEDCVQMRNWQMKGGFKREEFNICELVDGKMLEVHTREEKTLERGVLTKESFREFIKSISSKPYDMIDFLPQTSLLDLTDGECLDVLFDMENQDHLTDEEKFKLMQEFLMTIANIERISQ